MATYQIHRLRPHLRQGFRFAPHVSGVTNVKQRDYEAKGTVEAATPYAAFFALKESPDALELGDVLESVLENNGQLRILKFVGFEEAQWVVVEAKVPMMTGLDTGAAPAAIQ